MNSSKRIMIVIGIVIVVICVILSIYDGCHSNKNAITVGFDPLDGQLALTQRVYDSWFGERIDIMNDPRGKRVVCGWFMYKAYAESKSNNVQDALEQFNEDSMGLAVAYKVRSDYWASAVAWETFKQAAFDENRRQELYNTCMDVTPELPKYFMNEVNAFKMLAKNENLLDAQGNFDPTKDRIAFLLYRHLWLTASELQFPRKAIEPPEEAMTMFRWQIEVSNMPLAAKLDKLSETKKNYPHAYDYDYAEAYLLVLNGRYAEACNKLKPLIQTDGVVDAYRQNLYQETIKQIQKADASACPQ